MSAVDNEREKLWRKTPDIPGWVKQDDWHAAQVEQDTRHTNPDRAYSKYQILTVFIRQNLTFVDVRL